MIRKLLLVLLCAAGVSAHAALDPAQVRQLAAEDSADKVAAIHQLTQTADPDAVRVLQAMADDALYVARDKALIISGEQAFDAATGAVVDMPAEPEAVTVNNRLRGELANALAALKLFDADAAVRRASAQALQASADAGMAPLLARALERETDAGIKALLVVAHAQATLGDADPAIRLAAVKALADTASPAIRSLLQPLTDKAGEADDTVRYAAIEAVKAIDGRLAVAENLGRVFSGLSLGSILLLAALGLAIGHRATLRHRAALGRTSVTGLVSRLRRIVGCALRGVEAIIAGGHIHDPARDDDVCSLEAFVGVGDRQVPAGDQQVTFRVCAVVSGIDGDGATAHVDVTDGVVVLIRGFQAVLGGLHADGAAFDDEVVLAADTVICCVHGDVTGEDDQAILAGDAVDPAGGGGDREGTVAATCIDSPEGLVARPNQGAVMAPKPVQPFS